MALIVSSRSAWRGCRARGVMASLAMASSTSPTNIVPTAYSSGVVDTRHRWDHRRRLSTHQTAETMSPQEMAIQQTKLRQEASRLTRGLYRKCLQSIALLAGGNERDEADFAEREEEERSGGMDFGRVSMAPPVNRTNELSSRAEYYRAFARENFDGHWSLLGEHGFHIGDEGSMRHGLGGISEEKKSERGYYMWKEDQIEQFVYLIRSGEERRKWVLNDYEFKDPFSTDADDSTTSWSSHLEERLAEFEAQSNSLVKEMYRQKGWMHSSDQQHQDSDDDGFFSDSDSDDDMK